MKIGIMGAGALGTLFAGMLAINGTQTILCARKSSRSQALISKGYLDIKTAEGKNIQAYPILTDNVQDLADCDFVLLCVKAYSTAQAAAELTEVYKKGIIVSFQNGIGNIEALQQHFPDSRIAAGITSEGADLREPGYVVHGGKGITILSIITKENKALEPLIQTITESGLRGEINSDFQRIIWKKLIVNATVNPLTAIAEVNNAQMCKDSYLNATGKMVIKECVECCHALGINFQYDEIVEYVFETCRKTGANRSSMYQDILKNSKTEIDFISGAIEEIGKKYNISTIVNSTLRNIIKAKEAKNE